MVYEPMSEAFSFKDPILRDASIAVFSAMERKAVFFALFLVELFGPRRTR